MKLDIKKESFEQILEHANFGNILAVYELDNKESSADALMRVDVYRDFEDKLPTILCTGYINQEELHTIIKTIRPMWCEDMEKMSDPDIGKYRIRRYCKFIPGIVARNLKHGKIGAATEIKLMLDEYFEKEYGIRRYQAYPFDDDPIDEADDLLDDDDDGSMF